MQLKPKKERSGCTLTQSHCTHISLPLLHCSTQPPVLLLFVPICPWPHPPPSLSRMFYHILPPSTTPILLVIQPLRSITQLLCSITQLYHIFNPFSSFLVLTCHFTWSFLLTSTCHSFFLNFLFSHTLLYYSCFPSFLLRHIVRLITQCSQSCSSLAIYKEAPRVDTRVRLDILFIGYQVFSRSLSLLFVVFLSEDNLFTFDTPLAPSNE